VGAGIVRRGEIDAQVRRLVAGRSPDGRVLADLLDGLVVDERSIVAVDGEPVSVLIALLEEAGTARYGTLLVGRFAVRMAPLTPAQKAQLRDASLRAVDDRPLAALAELRSLRAGTWTWELYNVRIRRIDEHERAVEEEW
jgi:hypothetical protein